MNLTLKVVTYALFISIFDDTSTIPILGRVQKSAVDKTEEHVLSEPKDNRIEKCLRVRRQDPLVQPVWTATQGFGMTQDLDVKVTDRKLVETEAIRQYIHGTVENDTFAVDLDKSDFKEGIKDPEVKDAEESGAIPESKAAPELKVVPQSKTGAQPEAAAKSKAVPKSGATESGPKVVPKPKMKAQPRTESKSSKKSKKGSKTQSAKSSFLTRLRSKFINPRV